MKIYTDGACSQNGSQNGGWGVVILADDNTLITELSGGQKDTTNNQMELKAVIEGMRHSVAAKETAIIYTDSAYIHNCFVQKWYINWRKNSWKNAKKQPVANKELWEELLSLYETGLFTIEKVKGHTDNTYNDRADFLAVEGRKSV